MPEPRRGFLIHGPPNTSSPVVIHAPNTTADAAILLTSAGMHPVTLSDRTFCARTAGPEIHRHFAARNRVAIRVLAVIALALMVASACGSAEPEPIATNDGGVLVRPPDVLDGDPISEDSADSAAEVEQAEGPAPVDFVWFDGTAGSTSDFAGTPTVVNFWASTCAACIAEMPEFESVSQSLAGQVNFVGINVADIRSQADKLAADTGVTYPLIEDPDSAVFRSYGGFVMPTTVLLGADGLPAYTWAGILTESDLRILINDHIAPGTNDV